MKKKVIITTIIILLISIFYAFGGQRLAASCIAKATTEFNIWPADDRILYENGAEKIAEEVSKHLDTAIETVEKKQFGKFDKQVIIYVFASAKSFSRYAAVSEEVKGAGLGSKVYLSGNLLKTMDETKGILTHELSHVQLMQHLGIVKFNRSIPRWFREGLAIYVSNGGGATRATEQETRENLILGKHFIPENNGSLLNSKLNTTAPIHPSVSYRQSGDFVKFLVHEYPIQMNQLIIGIQTGISFQDIFTKSLATTPEKMLGTYINTLKEKADVGTS